MAAVNEIFLGIDTYLAHLISGTIRPNEWIPVIFGLVAGGILLLAGLLAFAIAPWRDGPGHASSSVRASRSGCWAPTSTWCARSCPRPSWASGSGGPAGVGAAYPGPADLCAGGRAGDQRRLDRGPAGQRRRWCSRAAAGCTLPYSKTRAYFFLVSMGTLATVISTVLDHARTGFENPWLWVPTAIGILGVVVALAIGIIDHPSVGDLRVYAGCHAALDPGGASGVLAARTGRSHSDERHGPRAIPARARRSWRRSSSATWGPWG